MVLGKIKNKLVEIFRISKWTLSLVYQIRPRLLVAVLFSNVLISALPFLRNRLFGNVIDQILLSVQSNNNAWLYPFFLFVFVSIFVSVVFYLQNFLSQMLGDYINNDLRLLYIDKISELDYQYFENKDTSNLIAKTTEEYRWRTQQVIRDLGNLLSNLVSLIVIGIIIIPHYWFLAILLFFSQIPNILSQYQLVKKDWDLFNSYSEPMRQGWDLDWQLSNKNYLAEIKINHSKSYLFNKMADIWNTFVEAMMKNRRSNIKNQFLNIFISTGVTAFCLYTLVGDIRQGLLSIGLFTFYFQSIGQINDIFSGFVNSFISISQQNLYISNFKKIMDLKNIIVSGSYRPKSISPPLIEFKNLTFHYPDTSKNIFNDFNLTINPEDEIAIVGANGAGKSTLIKLLLRQYDPQAGQILINGIDLRQYCLEDWYKYLSCLSQEFNIFQNLNLGENVTISHPKLNSTSKIISALKQADAYSFTQKYQDGLNTMMSQKYGGVEPSWGQWQKIAIARVFYRNSPIMILDEPTASIDAVSEAKIFSHLYRKNQHKTLIIVSHRFSTVRNAKKIIVIDQGKIIEQGSHQDLIKLNGLYSRSFNLQAKGYSDL